MMAVAMGLAAPAAALAAPCQATATPAPVQAATPAEIVARAEATATVPGAYPEFCTVPAAPTDLRPPVAWAAAIDDLRRTGDETVALAQSAFTDQPSTDSFTAEAMRDATPPPALTTPSNTEDFARSLRARATPPPRPR